LKLPISFFIIIFILLYSSTAFAADKNKSLDSPSSQRIQYLDNYTQTLKNEVIHLGRFLSDLAWVGSIPSSNSKKAAKSKNTLSKDLLMLGQTLTGLEDGLLTPPGFPLVVFLSLNASDDFILREINLSVNGKKVQSRKYKAKEVQALHKGGAHRLYIANLPEGKHEITVSYVGGTGNKSEHQNKKSFSFKKTSKRKTLEFKLASFFGSPEFTMKEWD